MKNENINIKNSKKILSKLSTLTLAIQCRTIDVYISDFRVKINRKD